MRRKTWQIFEILFVFGTLSYAIGSNLLNTI